MGLFNVHVIACVSEIAHKDALDTRPAYPLSRTERTDRMCTSMLSSRVRVRTDRHVH